MKKKINRNIILLSILFAPIFSCKKEALKSQIENVDTSKSTGSKLKTLGIPTPQFNWETVNWMPTPKGQSQISPPWIGQGSITSTYGIDVANDYKSADGWQLVYNTFDPNATDMIVNPYFILYNKFRGIMRIYMYTTGTFVYPSTYLVDGLSLLTNYNSSMLNFLGNEIVDPASYQSKYSQIEPAPTDGSQPLASNKWYMLQYELAYDPNLQYHNSSDTQLSWFTNFNSVSTISLGGTETGSIKTPTGAPNSAINSALQKGGTVAGGGTIAVIGQSLLNGSGNNGNTGVNNFGLATDVFKNIYKGVSSAVTQASSNIPQAIVGILSAIIGGNSSAPTVNLDFNSTIKLSGTQSTAGSFPSSPTSFYVPGTLIPASAQSYIPLTNDLFGVFNLTDRPTINVYRYLKNNSIYHTDWTYDTDTNYPLFIKNPKVINDSPTGATIIRETIEPIIVDPVYNRIDGTTAKVENVGSHTILSSTGDLTDSYIGMSTEDYPADLFRDYQPVAVRVIITLHPNSYPHNSKDITLVKTFTAKMNIIYTH